MVSKFSLEYPLGFTASRYEHTITGYLSWEEVYEFVRTGNGFTTPEGIKYEFRLSSDKEKLPLITYKGDFGSYQSNDSFRGSRSPYLAIDIDLDEKLSGFEKRKATLEQRASVDEDFNMILGRLRDTNIKVYLMKKSSSGCGRHIIVKLAEAEPSKIPLYEEAIMDIVQEQINALKEMNYYYKVDTRMKILSQGLHINHDPHVVFDPSQVTSALLIVLPEYHVDYTSSTNQVPGRQAGYIDRDLFKRFTIFCDKSELRLSYDDVFRLGLVWHCIYPTGSRDEFVQNMLGFNTARSKERGNSERFLGDLYNAIQRSSRTYKGKRISVDSLYYFLEEHKYGRADLILHFTGYLANAKQELFALFDRHPILLFEAPTGAGKTRLIFEYIKDKARKYPDRQYVFALPYQTMVNQFALENSDDEFAIQVLHSSAPGTFPAFIKHDTIMPAIQPTKVIKKDDTNLVAHKDESFVASVEQEEERVRHLRERMTKKKNKKKDEPVRDYVRLLPEPKPKLNNIWCATTDSASRVKHLHILVVDEAHDLIKQYGFRPDAVNSLDRINAERVIYVTATPSALIPEVMGSFYVQCIKDDKPRQKLNVIQVSGGALAVLKEKVRGVKSSLSFINDRRLCRQVQEELFGDGIEVSVYSSDEKWSEHFKALSKNRTIAEHSVATSILQEGLNVENLDIKIINIVNEYDLDNIIQAVARPRKCLPEINLIYSKTFSYRKGKLTPKLKIYQVKMEYYQCVADRLNALVKEGSAIGRDTDHFAHMDDDNEYVKYDTRSQSYRVDVYKVKYKVNVEYAKSLYNFCYDEWIKKLRLHFDVTEINLKNDAEDPNTELDFNLFRSAGGDVILAFCNYAKLKKKNKYAKMPSKLVKWSEENEWIHRHRDWQRWTERYVAMNDAGEIDWKLIENDKAYAYWKRKYDFKQSVIQGGLSAKDVNVQARSLEMVKFMLAQDTSRGGVNANELYVKMNEHLSALGYKTENGQKIFYNKISAVIEVKVKQKSNGTRYIAEIIDKRKEFMSKDDNIKDFDL